MGSPLDSMPTWVGSSSKVPLIICPQTRTGRWQFSTNYAIEKYGMFLRRAPPMRLWGSRCLKDGSDQTSLLTAEPCVRASKMLVGIVCNRVITGV